MFGLSSAPFESTVNAANEWIAQSGTQVINVETLTDTGGMGGTSSTSQDGVRIWYIKA